ncbi:unnamed protein product, partial [marine sediment metagenome]
MNGEETIEKVRKELSEAKKSAKEGDPELTNSCLKCAYNILHM